MLFGRIFPESVGNINEVLKMSAVKCELTDLLSLGCSIE